MVPHVEKMLVMTNFKNRKWCKFHCNFLFILEVWFDKFRPVKLSQVLKYLKPQLDVFCVFLVDVHMVVAYCLLFCSDFDRLASMLSNKASMLPNS